MPERLLDYRDFGMLSQILPMLTDQNFFQTLTTRMIESALLGIIRELSLDMYVFIFDFWK